MCLGGIQQHQNNNTIKAWFSDNQLNLETPANMRNANLNVYDLTGKNVLAQTINSIDKKAQVNTNNITQGIYLIRLNNNNEIYTAKALYLK